MTESRVNPETIAAAAARWVCRRDAGLSPEEQRQLEGWRNEDPRHARAFDRYAQTWSALDRPQHAAAVLGELKTRSSRRRRTAGAAALAIGLIGTIFWQTRTLQPAAPIAAASPGGTLMQPDRRLLPDGSVVELKSGAEIQVAFEPALRRVVLVQGEAHFQVAKNSAWPFAVETGTVQVRAVGTAFSVQRGQTAIEVVVTEGRIAVEKPFPAASPVASTEAAAATEAAAQASAQTLVFADAGQRVVFSAQQDVQPAEVVPVSANEMAERLAWRAPRVEFSGTPLAEAVAMMNRSASQKNVQLVLDVSLANLAREPISGMFRADNAETFVRMLELSLGVQAERRGGQIVLKKESRR